MSYSYNKKQLFIYYKYTKNELFIYTKKGFIHTKKLFMKKRSYSYTKKKFLVIMIYKKVSCTKMLYNCYKK